jgi:site-specific DNA recombinase
MKKAAIYRRISTTYQEDNTSLEGQLDACRKYAAQYGFNVVADFQDVASGENLDRVGFRELERLVERKEIDAVIVYHQDRLSRNLVDTLLLIQRFAAVGVELHDTTQGEIRDSLLSTITAVLSAEEKKNIRRRMDTGARNKIKKGQVLGNGVAPYGFTFVGSGRTKELIIDEAEAEAIRMMRDLLLHEGYGINRIARKLTDLNIPTPRQTRPNIPNRGRHSRPVNEWSTSGVYNILTSDAIHGVYYHYKYKINEHGKYTESLNREEWVGVSIPPIISIEDFEAIQEQLSKNKQMSTRNAKHFYLLGRRIRCSCGYSMTGMMNNEKRCYRCQGSKNDAVKPCRPTVSVYADAIEPVVWQWLREDLSPEKIRAGLLREREQVAEKRAMLLHQEALLQKQLVDLEARLRRVNTAYISGVFSLEETAMEKGKIEIARRSIDADLALLYQKLADVGPSDDEVADIVMLVDELHRETEHIKTDEERRWLIDKLDVQVEVERIDDEYYVNIRSRIVGIPGTSRRSLGSIRANSFSGPCESDPPVMSSLCRRARSRYPACCSGVCAG